MIRTSLAAVVTTLICHSYAVAQDVNGKGATSKPPTQCWDQIKKQVRLRTASDAIEAPKPKAGPEPAIGDGSSEGAAGIAPGSRGSASATAAAEAGEPTGRPAGMADC